MKPTSLTRFLSLSFSTHLWSNKKRIVNYKQRARSSIDIPVPFTSLYFGSFSSHLASSTGLVAAELSAPPTLPDSCHPESIIMRGFLFLSLESILSLHVVIFGLHPQQHPGLVTVVAHVIDPISIYISSFAAYFPLTYFAFAFLPAFVPCLVCLRLVFSPSV